MNKIQLTVTTDNGDVLNLDVYEQKDLSPRIFKQQIDPTKLDKVSLGDYTLNLKLPKTTNNLKLFKYVNNPAKTIGFVDIEDYNCQLTVNGLSIIDGTLIIDKITFENIEATIIGEGISWKRSLGERKLRDIRSFEKFRFSGMFGDYAGRWTADIGSPDKFIDVCEIWSSMEDQSYNYIQSLTGATAYQTVRNNKCEMQFPITARKAAMPYPAYDEDSELMSKYGQTLLNDGVENSSYKKLNYFGFLTSYVDTDLLAADNNQGPILLTGPDVPIDLEILHPSVYLKATLRNIFTDIGLQIGGTFMDDPETDNLLIPYLGDQESLQQAWNWGLLGKHRSTSRVKFLCLRGNNALNDFLPRRQLSVNNISSYFSPPMAPQKQGVNDSFGDEVRFSNLNRDYKYTYYINYEPFTNAVNVGGLFTRDFALVEDDLVALNYNYLLFDTNEPNFNVDRGFNPHAYYCPIQGEYEVKFKMTISSTGFTGTSANQHYDPYEGNVRLFFDKNYRPDDPISSPLESFYEGNQTLPANGSITFEDSFIYTYDETASGVITPLMETKFDPFNDPIREAYVCDFEYFEVNPVFGSAPSMTEMINPAKFLPDVKISDFIKTIANLYNLELYIESGSVFLNYKSQAGKGSTEPLDWTNKCDLNQSEITRANNYNSLSIVMTDHEYLNRNSLAGGAGLYYIDQLSDFNFGATNIVENNDVDNLPSNLEIEFDFTPTFFDYKPTISIATGLTNVSYLAYDNTNQESDFDRTDLWNNAIPILYNKDGWNDITAREVWLDPTQLGWDYYESFTLLKWSGLRPMRGFIDKYSYKEFYEYKVDEYLSDLGPGGSGPIVLTENPQFWVGSRYYLDGQIPLTGSRQDQKDIFKFTYTNISGDTQSNTNFPTCYPYDVRADTIYREYYNQPFKSLNNQIIIELPVYLTPQDIANFNSLQPVQINGIQFKVLEIKGFNPAGNGVTKVKLLKV